MNSSKRTRRLSLLAVSALLAFGLAATFAATADSTSTGDLEVTSAEVEEGIDVRIADVPIPPNGSCADVDDTDYVEDQTIDLLTVADAEPDGVAHDVHYCLKNFGTEEAQLDALVVEDVVSTELGCTFDEQTEDADCDTSPTGELDPHILSHVLVASSPDLNDCWVDGEGGTDLGFLGQGTANPIQDGTTIDVVNADHPIPSGSAYCVTVRVVYDAQDIVTDAERLAAQSDRLAWQIRNDTVQA